MMNLNSDIKTAERKLIPILETFFISIYDENYLSSHGLDHHRRVWHYSKSLLPGLTEKQLLITPNLPSKLLIACYLHDIGMSIDPGIHHGKHSRDLCIQFLQKNNLQADEYSDVLEAIYLHDIKDSANDLKSNTILMVLTSADDLDAYGFTGIFRYLEIYLARGMDYKEIGIRILDNAAKRFENFVIAFGLNDTLTEKHKKRYDILTGFFKEYNNQILTYQFGEKKPAGHCGVAEVLLSTINSRKSIDYLIRNTEDLSDDHFIRWYFGELGKELKVFK